MRKKVEKNEKHEKNEEENHVGKHAVKLVKQKENRVKKDIKGKQREEDKFLCK